jgi:hypothetical protein
MIRFPAYATRFEMYPQAGAAFEHLSPLLEQLKKVPFDVVLSNVRSNNAQMTSELDEGLEDAIVRTGGKRSAFRPAGVPQRLDFAFEFGGRTVAVEVEKTARDKILRDVLKCHMYLHAGADFAVIVLPRNYVHTHGTWDLFAFGVHQLTDCSKYGFGQPETLERILLLGYDQHDVVTDALLSRSTRDRMRLDAGIERLA